MFDRKNYGVVLIFNYFSNKMFFKFFVVLFAVLLQYFSFIILVVDGFKF